MDNKTFHISVPGIPATAGSKIPCRKKSGKLYVRDSSGKRGVTWRQAVQGYALQKYRDVPTNKPVSLTVEFHMPRPKSHYRSNGELKSNAPRIHTKRPDATKMLRAVEDALNKIVWRDDSQIHRPEVKKVYSEKPRCEIHIGIEEIKRDCSIDTGIMKLPFVHCEALLLFVNVLEIVPHAACQGRYAG